MGTDETCEHEWGVEDLAVSESGDAVDVCVKCGALRYVTDPGD